MARTYTPADLVGVTKTVGNKTVPLTAAERAAEAARWTASEAKQERRADERALAREQDENTIEMVEDLATAITALGGTLPARLQARLDEVARLRAKLSG